MSNKVNNKVNDKENFIKIFNNKMFSGYIWMVEEQYPTVYDKEAIDFNQLDNKGKVYNKIQEAYLTDEVHSIHIKNIDGEEKFFVFAYDEFKNENNNKYKTEEKECYPSHLQKTNNKQKYGIENLCFQQVYELTPNEISPGFENWIPVVKIFKGINLKNN